MVPNLIQEQFETVFRITVYHLENVKRILTGKFIIYNLFKTGQFHLKPSIAKVMFIDLDGIFITS